MALRFLAFQSQVLNFLTSVKSYSLSNICVSVFQSVMKNAEFWLYPNPTEPGSLRERWTPHQMHSKKYYKRMLFTLKFKNHWFRHTGKLIKYLGNRISERH